MSEDYKFQLSVKFGEHDTSMLNIRADTAEELDNGLRAVIAAAGNLAVCAETVRAVDMVAESFPGTQVVGSQGNAPAAAPAQPAPAASGPDYTWCRHGKRVEKSGGQGADTWHGYFCPLPKNNPDRCPPVYPDKAKR